MRSHFIPFARHSRSWNRCPQCPPSSSLARSLLFSPPSRYLGRPFTLTAATLATSALNDDWVSSLSFELLARKLRLHTQEKGDPLRCRSAPGPHRGLEERHEYGSHTVSMRLLELIQITRLGRTLHTVLPQIGFWRCARNPTIVMPGMMAWGRGSKPRFSQI